MSTLFVAQSIIVTIIFCNPIIETSQGGAEIKAMGNNIIYVFVDTKEQRKVRVFGALLLTLSIRSAFP